MENCVLCYSDKDLAVVEMGGKKLALCKECAKGLALVLEARGPALSKHVRRLAKEIR